MKMSKKILVFFWGISMVALGLLAFLFHTESNHFFGIADDQEQTILFESPVDIMRIFVVEGEEVHQGQLIMEVQQDALRSELVIIEEQLTELKTRDRESVASLRAKLTSLRAQQQAHQANLDSRIQSLQSRYDLNQSLLAQLVGPDLHIINGNEDGPVISPILAEIEGLKRERLHITASLQAEIKNIEAQLSASMRPIDAQIAELEERKSALQHQATRLKIRSKFDGRVGTVMFRPGETVPPFQPILTVHGSSPSFVKGYIHENVLNKVRLGQQVYVQSTTSAQEDAPFIESTVESLGTRIVEYPERLKKNLMVRAWGREVVVRLSRPHDLLLGEKVIVLLEKQDSMLARIGSSAKVLANFWNPSAYSSADISNLLPPPGKESFIISNLSNDNHIDTTRLEASGVLWDPDQFNYLLISDESPDGQPGLYRMDGQGRIINRVEVQGGPKIDDLESISADGPYVYLLSSLSHNKKGKLKTKRRQFIRLEQEGSHMICWGSFDLYQVLEQLATTAHDPATAEFLQVALQSRSINIEGHVVRNGNLFLGFKAPRNAQGQTVILRITDLDSLFKGNTPQGEIWQTVNLVDSQTKEPALLSDMLWVDNTLLLLGIREDLQNPVSHLWAYDRTKSELRELATFPDLKAEGISRTQHHDVYMVVADGGGKTASRYLTVNLENIILAART